MNKKKSKYNGTPLYHNSCHMKLILPGLA